MADPSNMFSKLNQQRQESAPEPAPDAPGKPADKTPQRRRGGKRSDPNYKQIGPYLSIDLYRRVKAKAALEGLDISDVAEELFERWVNESAED